MASNTFDATASETCRSTESSTRAAAPEISLTVVARGGLSQGGGDTNHGASAAISQTASECSSSCCSDILSLLPFIASTPGDAAVPVLAVTAGVE